MNKKIISIVFLIFLNLNIFSVNWNVYTSNNYLRLSDSVVRDIDKDGIDEIIVSSFTFSGKFIDVYKIDNGNLKVIDKLKVPERTIFFDVGDLDNDGSTDIVFLTSNGLYYRNITENKPLRVINSIFSEIVVAQPELLKSVTMIIDLNGDGKNELIIENVRAIEIYETASFTKKGSINLETVLEFSMVPGQFYPQYIFYTLPIILVDDLDNDNKKEIITKFPHSVNIYGQTKNNGWYLKSILKMKQDNVYFLSNSFVKFSFPVISDIDNDKIKEIVVSSANLDLPRIRFEAVGDLFYLDNNVYKPNKNKQIVIKGIPLNLPYFITLNNQKYKDFLCPVIPFNLISIFGLLSGGGTINVPFMYYEQKEEKFDMIWGKKMFEIPFRIENITSFVEALPFDTFKEGEFPDFYYFIHNFKYKNADILYYYYDQVKKSYQQQVIQTLSLPYYTPELPATLKLGKFSKNSKKDVLFIIHRNFYVIARDNAD
ncbi:MAG: hypothetical protein A2Y34_03890 [Spirochaetes bacterium GWC1_27_15]|nr:MAG: hypothetical protein A2Z98_05240 [Spirochaetes bacterium GWB1_27_13]OHD25325.1 MAG: hypothetical protein A2Y34_03890 [Spirochaetes bacterium GWC1_27_15]